METTFEELVKMSRQIDSTLDDSAIQQERILRSEPLELFVDQPAVNGNEQAYMWGYGNLWESAIRLPPSSKRRPDLETQELSAYLRYGKH